MKFLAIGKTAFLIATIWTTSSASVSFNSSAGVFDSLQINDQIVFTITAPLEDNAFHFILNDVYASYVFSPNESFSFAFVSEPTALINGTIESSASFASLVNETQWNSEFYPFTAGYDPLDLSIVYFFEDGVSLIPGDKVTLNIGTVFKQTGFDIPEPDNLSSSLVGHLIAESFDQRISSDQTISIVPETSFGIPVSLLCFVMCLAHFRSKAQVTTRSNVV